MEEFFLVADWGEKATKETLEQCELDYDHLLQDDTPTKEGVSNNE